MIPIPAIKPVAFALILAAPRVSASEALLAGTYRTVGSEAGKCSLQIDSSDRFVQRCDSRWRTVGKISRLGNSVSLQSDLHDAFVPQEFERAAGATATYMQWHFSEHGYYPVVSPPRLLEDHDHLRCAMVLVRLSDAIYLVDLFQQKAFCTAATASRAPSSFPPPHRVFVRRALRSEQAEVTWQALCAPGWKIRLE